jgi:hypothetical protein
MTHMSHRFDHVISMFWHIWCVIYFQNWKYQAGDKLVTRDCECEVYTLRSEKLFFSSREFLQELFENLICGNLIPHKWSNWYNISQSSMLYLHRDSML